MDFWLASCELKTTKQTMDPQRDLLNI